MRRSEDAPPVRPQPAEVNAVASAPPVAKQKTPALAKRKNGLNPWAQRLMWDAHSVSGVALGLVLFVIFFAGAFALYRTQLDVWADPALRGSPQFSTDELVLPVFEEKPPAYGSDVLYVFPFGERRSTFLRYTAEGDSTLTLVQHSTTTGEELARGGKSRLSLTLFQLHFLLQLRYILPGHSLIGIAIAGIIAVFLLFALLSGLLIHLRKLPQDWHTFRAKRTARTWLTDAHVVLGVVGLPFTLLFALTGAIISIMIIMQPQIVDGFFGGDADAYQAAIYGTGIPEADSTGIPAVMLSPETLVAQLPEGWEGIDPITLTYERWGDAGATATLRGHISETLTTSGKATLNAATGAVLTNNPPVTPTALGATYAVTEQLHYADVGGWLLDALFFLLAMAASAVILTGNVIWIVVRRPRDERATPRTHYILGRLTVGFGCGLVAAVAAFFIIAQALPDGLEDRKVWEESLFFGVWGLLILAAFIGPTAQKAARWQLALSSVLCALVPVANGLKTGGWLWASVHNGWWVTFWIDAGFIAASVLLGLFARRIR
ncbi:MAG: PepSY-associated TM helix domain-containing protein [Bacteroidota bacterium]